MSSVLPAGRATARVTVPPKATRRQWLLAWLREPLLHFLLLGGLLFALDAHVNRDRSDPRVIVIDAAVDQQAMRVFREARGREPSADELYALRSHIQPGALAALGVQSDFTSDTTNKVGSSNTLALIYSYFLTDNLAIKFEGGIPAEFKLYGSGVVQPTGPLGSAVAVDLGSPDFNPLAKVTQWSPAILLQYYFRDAQEKIRPYVGVGATYTWFTDIKADEDFKNALNTRFGATLAAGNGKLGQSTTVDAAAADDLAPIFNMGVSAELTDRWSLSGSVSYTLLKTTANITIDAEDGTRLATSRTKLDLNPLVVAFVLGYRFDL